jgi:protein gp37
MGDRSAIEWCDATWNPLIGCARVSEGCRHCYAERMAKRLQAMGQEAYAGTVDHNGRWTGKVSFVQSALDLPFKWRKPRRIFVNSMSDIFHPSVSDSWRNDILHIIKATPRHTYMILTKRPEEMAAYFAWDHGPKYGAPMPANLWLGVSVEDQATADARIPWLLRTPAAVRFASYEPALGPVDFTRVPFTDGDGRHRQDALTGHAYMHGTGRDDNPDMLVRIDKPLLPRLDWVICGGESGPNARPMHPDWARGVRDQCAETRVPFFFKQWGEWLPDSQFQSAGIDDDPECSRFECAFWDPDFDKWEMVGRAIWCDWNDYPEDSGVGRVGKARAGRLLDGVTHDAFPTVPNTTTTTTND